ncbi:MAG: hypothetical protein KME64_04040 [Scytonematopsis contorta HA4267-MV1]|jgi:hypothetical protein|nr:hypothetical protein [Scytonematopsis contorta HA4267-MV1]
MKQIKFLTAAIMTITASSVFFPSTSTQAILSNKSNIRVEKNFIKSQNNKQAKPSTALKKAIIDALGTNDTGIIDKVSFYFNEVDLNDDKVKETIVAIQYSLVCSNRYCPLYVFQKKGSEYKLKATLASQKMEPFVAILPMKTSGWYNLATQKFNYTPRGLYWFLMKFNGKTYSEVSRVDLSPKKLIINSEKDEVFNLSRP